MKSWTTKDGQIIPYSELDDQHLQNIINMLKRNVEKCNKNLLAAYSFVDGLRGERAQYAVDGEIAIMEKIIDSLSMQLDNLRNEQKSRGILEE